MTSQDDLAQLKLMYQRGEISDEQYDVLRRHVLWGTPLPQLVDEVPPPPAPPPAYPPPGSPVPRPTPDRYASEPPPPGRGHGTADPGRYGSQVPGPARDRYASESPPRSGHAPGDRGRHRHRREAPPEPTDRSPSGYLPPAGHTRSPAGYPPSPASPAPGGSRHSAGPPAYPPDDPPRGRRGDSSPPRGDGRDPAEDYSPSAYLPPAGGYSPPTEAPPSRRARREAAERAATDDLPPSVHLPPPNGYPAPPERPSPGAGDGYPPGAGRPSPGPDDYSPSAYLPPPNGTPPGPGRPSPDTGDGYPPGLGRPSPGAGDYSPSAYLPPPNGSQRDPGRPSADTDDYLQGDSWSRREVVGESVVGPADAYPQDELGSRRARREATEARVDAYPARPAEDDDLGRQKQGQERPTTRRRRSLFAVLTSVVLALALVGAGVWWFALRQAGVRPADYASSICGSVRDWQQAVDSSNSSLVTSIAREEDRTKVRTAVTTYYTTVAGRTDQLRTTIIDAGVADTAGGQAYADSLAAAVGNEAIALRDLATRAGRLDPSVPATFQIQLQSLLTGSEAAVGNVSAALARPSTGTPTELRTAFSAEPSCAPYVG